MEASIYNLKLLGQVKQNNLKIYSIGSKMSLNYEITHLGTTLKTLINISEGKYSFCKIFRKSK